MERRGWAVEGMEGREGGGEGWRGWSGWGGREGVVEEWAGSEGDGSDTSIIMISSGWRVLQPSGI